MSAERPSATAVICTRNRVDDLRRALTSLAWQTERCTQVIVVDDSDHVQHRDVDRACAHAGVPVEVLRKAEPGLTASRNLAVGHASGDVTMFFDDDVVLHPCYVERLLDAFAASPELAGAGGSIDDDHEYGWRWLRAALMLPGRKTGTVYRSGWSTQLPRARSGPVQHLMGCNMAYRTALLRRHRFADEFAGYALGEDLELSHRLHLQGHHLASVGDARCWHLTSLPRHDRAWGYREVAIRPIVAGRRFNRLAFAVSASAFALTNALRNRERAAGNVRGIRDVMLRRPPAPVHTASKPVGGPLRAAAGPVSAHRGEGTSEEIRDLEEDPCRTTWR
jgi:GT2 family glycosyltransferase